MFRRLSSSLPPDPEYPADLEKLGYFLNEDDEIRSIEEPTELFEYFINRNERYNEKNREALNTCIRKIVLDRLHSHGMETLRLPLGNPANKPHIPILASRNLSAKKKVILVIPEAVQDLGIWAYRVIGQAGKDAMNRGSAVNFVKYVQSLGSDDDDDDDDAPGVIIANTGQLLWYRGGKRAVSFTTWDSLPRESAVHGAMRIDDVKNRVKGNASIKEHVAYVFDEVVGNEKVVDRDAQVFIVGLADGADELITFLNANWNKWSSRVKALALAAPLHSESDITDPRFAQFLKNKARAYILSSLPPLTPLSLSDIVPGSIPTFASGEEWFNECIMPVAYRYFVDFFEEVNTLGDYFVNHVPIMDTTTSDEMPGIQHLWIDDELGIEEGGEGRERDEVTVVEHNENQNGNGNGNLDEETKKKEEEKDEQGMVGRSANAA